MAIIGGTFGYKILQWIGSPEGNRYCQGRAYTDQSKLETLFGAGIWDVIRGKTVIDFGCGTGTDTIDIARRGAKRTIGIDIRDDVLEQARRAAREAGVAHRCTFVRDTADKADLIVSVDAFEHFEDPATILHRMSELLAPGGCVRITFGPPWLHPYGGHLFSVFPWAHVLFSEQALIRWRTDFKSDGATRFSEVEGGLNQMTLRKFKKLVAESSFRFANFEAVPIRSLGPAARLLPEEVSTAVVRCQLTH